MKLYDSSWSDDVKRTTPSAVSPSFLGLFTLFSFLMMFQVYWIVHVEKMYDQLISTSSCFGRRIRARLDNRIWNNSVIKFCIDNSIVFFDGRDSTMTSYVGVTGPVATTDGVGDSSA